MDFPPEVVAPQPVCRGEQVQQFVVVRSQDRKTLVSGQRVSRQDSISQFVPVGRSRCQAIQFVHQQSFLGQWRQSGDPHQEGPVQSGQRCDEVAQILMWQRSLAGEIDSGQVTAESQAG